MPQNSINNHRVRSLLFNLLFKLFLFNFVGKCECQRWISQLSSVMTMIDTLHLERARQTHADKIARREIASTNSNVAWLGCDAFIWLTNRSEPASNIVTSPFSIIASSATSRHKEQFATLHFNYAFTSRVSAFSACSFVLAEFNRIRWLVIWEKKEN